MKTLWTPWRMSYVTNEKQQNRECIFDINPAAKFDKENLILWRGPFTIVLLNRFPYANGHLLVAPVRHIADLAELADNETNMLMRAVKASVSLLRKHLQPAGFNIGLNIGAIAGAGLADHLHFHIVPRWPDDHNFMTVLADVRTIPEHIDQTFDKLLADFQTTLKD